MIKKIHLLFAFVLALPAASHAWIGGPWDNGDYNQLMDESGIYQANLTFSNGQGFCQFGSNVGANTFLIPTTTAPLPPTSTGTYLNRSVIYYKGVTYFGSCMGTSDLVNKIITGITNGNSDVTTTTTTSTTGQFSLGTDVLANGQRSVTCNTSWTANVTSTKPVLKFKGKGRLTVLNPDGIAQVTPVVDDLLATLGGLTPVAPATLTPANITNILSAINQIATGTFAVPTGPLADILPKSTAELTHKNSDSVPLTVYGIRKFFSTVGTTNGLATVRR